MKRLYSLPLLVSLCCLMMSCGAGRTLRKAEKHFDYGEYHEAAIQYGKAYRMLTSQERNLRAEAAYHRGLCFQRLNQCVKAENEFKKAIRYALPNDTVHLNLAQVYHESGKIKEAEAAYQAFLEYHPEDVLANNGLLACHKIPEWKQQKSKFVLRKSTHFSSRRGDFSPILIPTEYNSLLYSSSIRLKEGQKNSKITGLPDNDFWISRQAASGEWEKPVWIDAEINSEFDEGAGQFSADGRTLFFTRCVTKSDSIQSSSRTEVFRSTRTASEWSEPEKILLHRDSTVQFAHPCPSPDGLFLYFVSDLPGGYGGKDLWRCEMTDQRFGPPENLGPEINTPGDEVFPVFHPDGSLYFSSDGHPGFGGLDIFRIIKHSEDMTEVEHLPQPFNSHADDFGITFFASGEKGFLSSNRDNARGWDDIFQFEMPQSRILVTGSVVDRYGEELPDAILRIVNSKGMNTRIRTDKKGKYQHLIEPGADYALLGTARAYLNQAQQFKAIDADKDTTYVVNFTLTPLYRPVRIDNIFFAFDRADLLPESAPALEELYKLLIDNPHIVVELGAHTDRKGGEEYNRNLSERRAQAVVQYLTQEGIEAERLVAKGYGKQMPAKVDSYMQDKHRFLKEGSYLEESFIEGLSPEQQDVADQINRRCEFKVLKTTFRLF